MADKKKHHFVPRFLLKNFCMEDNKSCVWVYSKDKPNEPWPGNIMDNGMQNHFYSILKEGGDKDSSSVEDFLAEIDDAASSVVSKIIKNENITEEERKTLATFMSVMMSRTPNMRKNMNTVAKDAVTRATIQMLSSEEHKDLRYIDISRTKRLFYVTCSRAEKSLALIAYSDNPHAVYNHVISEGWFVKEEIEIAP